MPGRNTDVHSTFSIIQEREKDTFHDPVEADPSPSPPLRSKRSVAFDARRQPNEREHDERVCTTDHGLTILEWNLLERIGPRTTTATMA